MDEGEAIKPAWELVLLELEVQNSMFFLKSKRKVKLF